MRSENNISLPLSAKHFFFPAIAVSVLIIIILWLQPISFGLDFWVHGASIEIFATDTDNPTHPYLYDGMPERHLGLYEYILSRGAKLFDLSGAVTVLYASSFNLLLLLFVCVYLGRTIQTSLWFPTIVFLITTFGWGSGFSWSNDYAYHILPKTAGYPSTLATILILFIYGLLLRDFENPRLFRKITITLLATLVLITHQLTSFLLMFPLIGFLVVFAQIPLNRKAVYLAIGLTAMTISLAWPYYHWYSLLTKSFTGITMHRRPPGSPWMFYNWVSIMKAIGGGLLGFSFIPFLLKRKFLHLIVFLVLMLALWSLSFFIRIPLGHRTVYGCIFALHLIMIHGIAQAFQENATRLTRIISKSVIVLILISGLTVSVYQISKEYLYEYPQISHFRELSNIMTTFHRSAGKIQSITAADTDTNFSLPAFGTHTKEMSRFGSYRIKEIFRAQQQIDIPKLTRALQILHFDYLFINRRNEAYTKRRHAASIIKNYPVILTSDSMAIVYTGTGTATVIGHIDENGKLIAKQPIYSASFFELLSSDNGCKIEGSVTAQRKDFFYDGKYYHTGFGVKAPCSYTVSIEPFGVKRLEGIVALDNDTSFENLVIAEIIISGTKVFQTELSSQHQGQIFSIELPEHSKTIVFTVVPKGKAVLKNAYINWMQLKASR